MTASEVTTGMKEHVHEWHRPEDHSAMGVRKSCQPPSKQGRPALLLISDGNNGPTAIDLEIEKESDRRRDPEGLAHGEI